MAAAATSSSRPVRIGNAAVDQRPARRLRRGDGRAVPGAARTGSSPTRRRGRLQRALIEFLETAWHEPDEGIWEVRGPRRHFTHSKVMAWVAFDRAIKTVEQLRLEGPVERLAALRDAIHAEVCRRGFDPERGRLHAVLRRDRARREPADDPARRLPAGRRSARASGTVAAIERELLRRRVRAALSQRDAAPTSTACRRARAPSCRAPSGSPTTTRCRDAATRRARCSSGCSALRNDVGLLSEEYDPASRAAARQLSAGVLARVADQHRAQPHPPARAGARSTVGVGHGTPATRWPS